MAKRDIRKAQRAKDKNNQLKKEEKDRRNQSIIAQDTITEIRQIFGQPDVVIHHKAKDRFLSF